MSASIPARCPGGLGYARHWVLRHGKKPCDQYSNPKGWNVPDGWITYQEACEVLKRNGQGFDGLGFIIAREPGRGDKQIIGLDLDCCRDPITGWVSEWALELLKKLNSYSEITPSQTGFHVWIYAKLPEGKDSIYSEGQDPGKLPSEIWEHIKAAKPDAPKCNSLEIYEDGPRHFTFTGWFLDVFPMELQERQAELEQIICSECVEPAQDLNDVWAKMEAACKGQGLPKLDILDVINTSGFERSGDQLMGAHPILNSTTGHNLVVHPGMGCYAYMHNGLKKGGDAWTWLACEAGLVRWEDAGKGSLRDPEVLQKTKEYAIKKGLIKAEDLPKQEKKAPLRFPISYDDHSLTDIGNAERLVNIQGEDMRFCQLWKKWIVWNGRYWEIDESNESKNRAIEVAKTIFVEAATAPSKEKSREVGGWALVSASRGKIDAMLDLAKGYLAISPKELDQDPWLLNCRNGTLDLRSCRLQEHRHEDLITKALEIDYNPGAEAPYWNALIQRIFGGDQELIRYIQKSCGYTLTGSIKEQIWYLCYGTGQNGKSTFINALLFVLGLYGMTAKFDTFQVQRSEGVRNDLADMKGCRIVAAIEAKQGKRLDETVLKQLTGEDKIRARHLYAEFEEFVPSHKLWLIANHKPTVHETTKAFWRRVRLIPFLVTIPDAEVDKDLNKKLESESEGILAWMVEGCRLWQSEGLKPPLKVIEATEEYRGEMDILGGFLDDICELTFDWNDKVQSGTLFEHYNVWCQAQAKAEGEAVTPITRKLFGMKLTERGLKRDKIGGLIYWFGMKFKSAVVLKQDHLDNGNRDAENGSRTLGPLSPITSAIHIGVKECESDVLRSCDVSTDNDPMVLDGPDNFGLTLIQKANLSDSIVSILKKTPRKENDKLGLLLEELSRDTKLSAEQITPFLEGMGWVCSGAIGSGARIWWAPESVLKILGLKEI